MNSSNPLILERKNQKTRTQTNKILDKTPATHIIAPYGLQHNPKTQPHKIITQPNQPLPALPKTLIKTNNKIHSKLWLGKEKAITGSWNFTKNTTAHEIVIIHRKPSTIKQLKNHFHNIWNRTPLNKPGGTKKITKLEEMM